MRVLRRGDLQPRARQLTPSARWGPAVLFHRKETSGDSPECSALRSPSVPHPRHDARWHRLRRDRRVAHGIRRIPTRPPGTSAISRKAPSSASRASTASSAARRRPAATWLLHVVNISITPYTYTEDFIGDDAVLSRDNLKIAFRVHTVWRIDDTRVPLFLDRFSTTVGARRERTDPDAIVKVAYGNFVREPLRTFARDEVQRRNGLEVKEALMPIGDAVLARIRRYAAGQPVRHHQRRRRQRAVSGGGGRRRVAQAGSDAGTAAQGHGDRNRAQGAHEARGAGAGHRQRDADHPRAAERDVHPARGDRSAEADGRLAEPHGRLHPGRARWACR